MLLPAPMQLTQPPLHASPLQRQASPLAPHNPHKSGTCSHVQHAQVPVAAHVERGLWTATDALLFLATKKPFQALLRGWQLSSQKRVYKKGLKKSEEGRKERGIRVEVDFCLRWAIRKSQEGREVWFLGRVLE